MIFLRCAIIDSWPSMDSVDKYLGNIWFIRFSVFAFIISAKIVIFFRAYVKIQCINYLHTKFQKICSAVSVWGTNIQASKHTNYHINKTSTSLLQNNINFHLIYFQTWPWQCQVHPHLLRRPRLQCAPFHRLLPNRNCTACNGTR